LAMVRRALARSSSPRLVRQPYTAFRPFYRAGGVILRESVLPVFRPVSARLALQSCRLLSKSALVWPDSFPPSPGPPPQGRTVQRVTRWTTERAKPSQPLGGLTPGKSQKNRVAYCFSPTGKIESRNREKRPQRKGKSRRTHSSSLIASRHHPACRPVAILPLADTLVSRGGHPE